MKQQVTKGIILARTYYGEADRILTLLTPDYGKLRLLAKGVRREKSKLAGGIELFSVSSITFIQGRGDLGTLASTRLIAHYGRIVEDLDRTMLGYELIKQLNKATEDHPEPDYFELLQHAFQALNDPSLPLPLIHFWFNAQLLRLAGHTPNLQTDVTGRKLQSNQKYQFDFEAMSFREAASGPFVANHIKFLRLALSGHAAQALANIKQASLVNDCLPLLQSILRFYAS